MLGGVHVLLVDHAPAPLLSPEPDGGPLHPYTARPGAWYSTVFLPMSAHWPVQLGLWQREPAHEVRLLALDAPPSRAPALAVPVPVRAIPVEGGRVLLTAPLVLPTRSRADGVFLLVEQWRPTGDRPGPSWLQARSDVTWIDAHSSEGGATPAPAAPTSPLSASRPPGRALEIPLMQRPAPPLRDSSGSR